MKLENKEILSILTSEENYSLYIKKDMPLTKKSYFCKKIYCPKTMTLEIAETLYGEILDSDIDKLPQKND